ncbi:MAG: hypothetical protein O3A55_06755 [Bacteroidetes bacterium]|nr:hypothetical protein [Bacteroidota bacterium]
MKLYLPPNKTNSRKKEHVQLVVKEDVKFKVKSNNFNTCEFTHNSLPEINFSEIDTTTAFLYNVSCWSNNN